jgi:hypothetical protein
MSSHLSCTQLAELAQINDVIALYNQAKFLLSVDLYLMFVLCFLLMKHMVRYVLEKRSGIADNGRQKQRRKRERQLCVEFFLLIF